MPSGNKTFLIFLIDCVLFGLVYGLIGQKVRFDKQNELSFVVSISGRLTFHSTDPKHAHNLHICTGSLVSRKSVLTAAHCLTDKHPNQVQIIAGSASLRKGDIYYPESWITFDKWNHNQKTPYPKNDIAVIVLSGEGVTIPNISPARIVFVDSEYLSYECVRITGWGKMASGQQPIALKTATVGVLTNEECSLQGTMLLAKKFTVPPNYFCTKQTPYVVSTVGDGGAPITNSKRQLVGINIGTCPKVEGYPQETLNELQTNCHLNFRCYEDFLDNAIVK